MRKLLGVIIILIFSPQVLAQIKIPIAPDSLFPTYYHQRVSLFKSLPHSSADIIFLGNSITDGAEWAELFNDIRIKNRGISGDITHGVIHRLDEVAKKKPAKVFLLIGTNDLARGLPVDSVVQNILWICKYLKQETPATQLFVQSILPVNDELKKFPTHTNKGEQIKSVNEKLRISATDSYYTFVDLHTAFANEKGKLDLRYTNDGLHLTGEGYLLWKHLIYHRVYGLQEKPSLIPLPQQLQWKAGRFPLYQLTSIVIENSALQKEAERLQQSLSVRNISVGINKNISGLNILLKLGKVEAPNQTEEAYSLSITEKEIVVTANSPHGVSNGIRTLLQLMRDSTMIDTCEITDWPAFAWRGYMVDVGRNFQPVGLLKQQIEVMAKYKLNVFHLHLTEDIAWRLEVKRYPQLTAPESMLRNKGMYYAEADIKELIAYCKERHITFVPEIDMPGHSAAFTRAMKTSMQSDSGIAIVKNILKEICSTYDVPYIHIGADEVRITNRNFVPEVTAYIESLGKKVIGWQPGGNFTNNTIRQLWMDDKAHLSANGNIQFIDSRHLYLNHLDPLEAVTTIFNRKIGNKEEGDKTLLGGTICLWNDRAAANENDILRMNPVYPSMLAFAERAWQGGGQAGWIANIDDGDKKAFVNFENRLLDNKLQYFYNKPFAYVRQSNSQWKLYGPYNNGGDVTKAFEPEREQWKESSTKMVKQVTGATIVLRHWWAPLIKGALDNPTENTTWYATTTIWSEEEATKDFWIGFNNISRSPATDSPPQNGWDHKGSAVWVNGKLISPPAWKRPGQKGNADIPLIDEGYEYRTPTKIQLQKGFNTVVLKIPVGSFKGKDWQNPVKWMFTFVEVN